MVVLNGTKKGRFACVTKPNAVRETGFPALSMFWLDDGEIPGWPRTPVPFQHDALSSLNRFAQYY
jgi:hypothetical protein